MQYLFDKIKAMEKIKRLEVPSDGGFMANYNNRNRMKEKKEEEMRTEED